MLIIFFLPNKAAKMLVNLCCFDSFCCQPRGQLAVGVLNFWTGSAGHSKPKDVE